ncbi:MAG: histidinol-phosphate transaminase [Deltaproteobacteria bacterium]|nr:histidinol-phosphate transaminase [Deltaproteobacteria bacterium]
MDDILPEWVIRAVPEHIFSIPAYVPGKPLAELKRELGISGAVKMASNENPLGTSAKALEAIQRVAGDAHIYPEGSAPDLRRAIGDRFGLSPESVILGNGSDEIMQFAAHLFIRPGCEALVGSHTFSWYRICVEAFGGSVKAVPMKDYRFDLAATARAVTDLTRLIFLAFPNNPTGTIVSREEFESFLRDLPTEGLLIVLDEAYREFVTERDCPNAVDYIFSKPPVLVLRTFSKIHGLAGLRVGYGLAQPWLVELLNRLRPPFNVNSVAQSAALAALGDAEHLAASLTLCEGGRSFIHKELAGLGLKVIPSQANFVTFCLEQDARPVYEGLLREGVIVRHLASFGMEKCIRVTVGRREDNTRFLGALRKVMADLKLSV